MLFKFKSNILQKYRLFSTCDVFYSKLRVAVIGQSTFASEVYKCLRNQGHEVVGVFTIADTGSRADPLAESAAKDNIPVFKIKSWRKDGKALPEVVNKYKEVGADLNVLPFCSQFIPMEVINFPTHKSICYHPSILPKHRGVNAINWTLIHGDKEAGFSIFWADEGLDTGPILIQQKCTVEPNETVDTLYKRFLYPEGIKSMVKAVNMVADGTAPNIPQIEDGASFEPSLRKKILQKVDWSKSSYEIHNFIRGLDSSPGAWTLLEGKEVKLYGSKLYSGPVPQGQSFSLDTLNKPCLVHTDGLLIFGNDNKMINIERISIDGKMIPAGKFGLKEEQSEKFEYSDEEKAMLKVLESVWKNILCSEVNENTNFFATGAGSMDVVRLIEEVKDKLQINLKNEDVFMAPVFVEFCQVVVKASRGGTTSLSVQYSPIELNVNNLKVTFPHQLFINGEFVDSETGATVDCINPSNESVICKVQRSSPNDVDKAVQAAKTAFQTGEWSKISSRDRGALMYKLADLMDEHREELATIESLDSGAVYTLALKTHIGMSIETWRYFAGWADKIHGSTIPITHARPNRNLTLTKLEPIGGRKQAYLGKRSLALPNSIQVRNITCILLGNAKDHFPRVCGLITPWNYPLMMLSWKMAPCLAAGNVVVMKPAEVSPLTALKFAELTVKAGFPPGVINIVPGKGSETGAAIASHPDVRKLGFTGSTSIGQLVMRMAADSNLKKISLELGGKSPLIVFEDCDLDRSVRMSMGGVFFNKGENCIAAGRVFVESSIHDEFVSRVVEETKKMVIGDPLNRSTHHGPQNHKAHLDKLVEYCEIGQKEGAKLLLGGKRCDCPGYFFQPTIFTNVEDHMFIAKEESFGPIMVISKFSDSDIDGVIKRANCTEFGLASGIFTRDINKALYFSEKIDAGTVFINTYNKTDVAAPFGGFKQSGFGKDLGKEALNEYCKVKCITIEY